MYVVCLLNAWVLRRLFQSLHHFTQLAQRSLMAPKVPLPLQMSNRHDRNIPNCLGKETKNDNKFTIDRLTDILTTYSFK